ncbi:hypothetical protein C7974DRAFT_457163 [Boeremia exigua]|uniref:uncharacterized protein n=1 Tax=Boeremia exigua TaxID=749465 RepID=UPI001E8E5C48|nr:uncharacterized protein C7974DRAFT_457163 [Boeremia exigua]KAH6622186.1 hypothetical protein C7974DRAFT_457163 [Boeremia exigua]
MAGSKVDLTNEQKMRVTDDRRLVFSWLQTADQQEHDEDVGEVGDWVTVDPLTPSRRQLPPLHCEEVSPTNTSFSCNSLFDPPALSHDREGLDPFCDDVPDIAPANDQAWDLENKRERCGTALVVKPLDTTFDDADSLVSYDPPSEVSSGSNNFDALENTTASLIDPDEPRFVCITSCTQCILADLPCSRTVPHCSRCRRKGQEALCLLHRRTFREEVTCFDAPSCVTPVLLKLQGEDANVWEAKLRLEEELEQSWRAVEDRRNWVLPSLDGFGEVFRSEGEQLQASFPGEGKGRLTYKELRVATID